MKTTSKMNELAREYLRFKRLTDSEGSLTDQLQQYEMLNSKIERAGSSFYDVALYASYVTVK